MAYISQKERDSIPAEDFAGPNRTFPIRNQQDVFDAARLIGKAKNPAAVKAAIIRIAHRKGFKLPDAWTTKASMSVEVAEFALRDPEIDGEYAVYRDRKIFEAGEYPDKALSVSPEQLWVMAEAFEPVTGDLEHFFARNQDKDLGTLEALRGNLAHLDSVRVADDGVTLLGDVRVPVWLDKALPAKGISVEIPLEGEREGLLDGFTITTKPRVVDAALMSELAEFAGSRHSKADAADIQHMHDLTVKQGADCMPPTKSRAAMSEAPTAPRKEKHRMSLKEQIIAWFSQMPDEGFDPDGGDVNRTPVAPPAKSDEPTEREKALMSELATFKEKQATEAKARREAQVKADVESRIKSGKLAPASEETATVALLSALEDDEATPRVALFSDKTERNRYDTLLSLFDAQPQVVPMGEHPTAKVILSTNTDEQKPKSDAQKQADVERLLSMTPLGRTALAAKRNGNKEN